MPEPTPTVEGHGGIFVIRKHENCRDWNGIHYRAGMSSKNVGATELSMNVATIPPGGVAKAHIHVGFDLMLYIMPGDVCSVDAPLLGVAARILTVDGGIDAARSGTNLVGMGFDGTATVLYDVTLPPPPAGGPLP